MYLLRFFDTERKHGSGVFLEAGVLFAEGCLEAAAGDGSGDECGGDDAFLAAGPTTRTAWQWKAWGRTSRDITPAGCRDSGDTGQEGPGQCSASPLSF